MSGRDLVFVDVETTGLFSSDRIVSFAGIRVPTNDVLSSDFEIKFLHLVFDPGRKSHPKAEEVHGLDDWYLRHQAPLEEHIDELAALFADRPTVVAHNVAFDRQFIEREFMNAGRPLEASAFTCTMEAYRHRENGRASIAAILQRMGLQRSGTKHGAFEDAWFCLQIYRWLNGAALSSPPLEWPSFSNAHPVPPRPDVLPRRSKKMKKASMPSIGKLGSETARDAALVRLRPIALILDYIARADGRVDSEVAVLTDFLLTERPDIPAASVPDIVASWIDAEVSLSIARSALSAVDDRDKLARWIKRVVYADGLVSESEVRAMRELLSRSS